MGIFDIFKSKDKKTQTKYIEMMNGAVPVFSNFGENIYANDIIQSCIRCIATEVGKLKPRHIRTDTNGLQTQVNGSINRLLKFKPNEFMTTTDFLEKITYLFEINKNVFIYPAYREILVEDGFVRREYTGLYPLNPISTEFVEDVTGKIFVSFSFANGYKCTLPYRDLIHWRKDFGANEFMGGDAQGQPDNNALLSLLKTDYTVIQGIDKAIKSSYGVKGIVKIQTFLDTESQIQTIKEFENKIMNSGSGILPLDLKSDFIPVKIDPKVIDADTMNFITQRILNNYAVSLPIYNGDFNEEQYHAFYERNLENKIVSLGRCFSAALFTDRQLDVGNEIIFYDQGLNFTSMENKIQVVDILSSRGTLTDNQILAIFGYPPFDGGNIRKQSLNYINRDLADSYQMGSVRSGKEVT
uniref:Portal protein n=1 Tax=Siphoviridae sp. ctVqj4 TaxID=2826359 RepID=A0A8S5NJT0_9CAUD|nr:MAG TPA: portal protein [Siphoviridae sp. ctVqj4]